LEAVDCGSSAAEASCAPARPAHFCKLPSAIVAGNSAIFSPTFSIAENAVRAYWGSTIEYVPKVRASATMRAVILCRRSSDVGTSVADRSDIGTCRRLAECEARRKAASPKPGTLALFTSTSVIVSRAFAGNFPMVVALV